jgi:hypothetical protein
VTTCLRRQAEQEDPGGGPVPIAAKMVECAVVIDVGRTRSAGNEDDSVWRQLIFPVALTHCFGYQCNVVAS